MRARVAIATTLAALAATTLAHANQGPAKRTPSRLLVLGTEYRLQLSRAQMKRGPALIQFVNRGEDPHDLKLSRIGTPAGRTVSVPETDSGKLVQFSAHLSRGRYRLWCSLPGHEQRGMRATLSVRRAR